jgi:GPH family glycoside/pentoside/hexuronide:cation symporter
MFHVPYIWVLEVRLSNDLAANNQELQSLTSIADDEYNSHLPTMAVGSGVLSRKEITEEQLLAYINQIKTIVSKQHPSITYIDDYKILLEHPKVMAACDTIYANIYPFKEGARIDQAIERLNQDYLQLKTACGDKRIVIAETGWPDAGEAIGEAVPSPENAKSYFVQVRDWAKQNNVSYYYFEVFDESWREATEGSSGGHWGVFDQNGRLKSYLEDLFYDTP